EKCRRAKGEPIKLAYPSHPWRPRRQISLRLRQLRGLPEGFHLIKACVFRLAALFRERRLDGAETAHEFGVGAAQRRLRISLEVTGKIYHYKEQVADLIGQFLEWRSRISGLDDFVRFLDDFRDHLFSRIPIKSDARRAPLELFGAHERG